MNAKVQSFLQLFPAAFGSNSKWNTALDRFSSAAERVTRSRGIRSKESAYEAIGEEQRARPFGDLAYEDLRNVYLQSSSVRPCVDMIARTVSSLSWLVKAKPGGDVVHAQEVKEFFLDPNGNKESIRVILSKILTDMLILDMGVIEKVRSLSGNLLEIYARDAATFTPLYSEYGVLEGYVQRVRGDTIDFTPRELMLLQIYPRTWDFYGTPIIETCVDEVTTLMRSMAEIGQTFTRDEIPNGILALDKIGQLAYDRLKTDLTSEVGNVKRTLKILRNAKDAKWIDLKRPFREMQLAELNKSIKNIVRENFGLQEDMTMTPSMMLSMTQMLNYYFNQEIVNEFYDDIYFKLMPQVVDEKAAKATQLKTQAWKNLKDILEPDDLRNLIAGEFTVPDEALD